MKSVGPKGGANHLEALSGKDPYKYWDDFFKATKFKTPLEGENLLFATVADSSKAGRLDYVEAAIKKYLFYHGKDAQPWMYEMLVKAIEARKGGDKAKNEQDVKEAIGFAGFLAKKTKVPNDLVRIADMMVLRGYYGAVGVAGYQTNIGELIDLAADKVPANAVPPMMSINLATHEHDPKRMGDAAEKLLSLGWPLYDDKMRRDVKEQVGKLAETLKAEGKSSEADSLLGRLEESETRDVFFRLTWKGEADIDMGVAEPLGASANFQNPRTVFGGAIVKNGYGSHPEEVYVCPRAFPGDYTISIEKIADFDPAKPVLEASLEVILHEGSADEQRQTHRINVAKPQPIVVKLTKGRREKALPFLVAPTPPPVSEAPRTKDAPKPSTPPANASKGAPIR